MPVTIGVSRKVGAVMAEMVTSIVWTNAILSFPIGFLLAGLIVLVSTIGGTPINLAKELGTLEPDS
ncbi:MAG: hypothetical protein FJ358_06045 [Thaumarchaeota archaeon]|nr:hypothetical protein [Nitrososphaerota archaeon]